MASTSPSVEVPGIPKTYFTPHSASCSIRTSETVWSLVFNLDFLVRIINSVLADQHTGHTQSEGKSEKSTGSLSSS